MDLRETKDHFSLEVLFGVAPIGLMFLQSKRCLEHDLQGFGEAEGEMFVQERSHVSPG